ncbi:MAG TPA: HAMP domain-containing sensor histidine kinase [Polyangiaceae bacterium]|nr:HAMP domain-containing sensor histidine kinase [Polyangiaceae bacterium]
MERFKSALWFNGIFAAIVLSFFAATGVVHWQTSAIDRATLDVAESVAPGMGHLAIVRGEAQRLEALLGEGLARAEGGGAPEAGALESSRQALERSIGAYLALPLPPGEAEARGRVLRAKGELDGAVARYRRESGRGELGAAASALRADVRGAAAELALAASDAIESNAGHAAGVAARMKRLRAESTRVAFGLDAACALVAFSGALLLGRSTRARAEAGDRRRRLQEERASELELFAGRVAHDILSPLGTVGYALELAADPGDEAARRRALQRGQAALERVKRLVTGLLDFARAGGQPDAGARADVAGTIADLVSELGPTAAEAGAVLSVKMDVAGFVACNPGVLTSLVANLARNAVKYLGDGPVRRVEIRVRERGGFVRVEVEDTGPGLAPDLEGRIFEPYVRAPAARQPGLGLGLATVKRLAEAHGGKVGVRSVVGQGSTFWFELPKAEGAAPARAEGATRDGLRAAPARLGAYRPQSLN